MRNLIFSCAFLLAFGFAVLLPARSTHRSPQEEPQSTQQPTAPTAPPAVPTGPVIILDPGHGGIDTGARGAGGVAEKDIVLQVARTVRGQLSIQGYRVVLTRKDDSNPTYDDRAAVANAYREAIFVSFHVASTGASGTVRAYYDQFSAAAAPQSMPRTTMRSLAPLAGSLVVWDQAQGPYFDQSRRLADVIQSQLARSFPGSPQQSTGASVRTLRSVMAPAVAIETSSISVSTPDALVGAGGLLSSAIADGISALRQSSAAGAR
ncbi:MAG TPA: N-acetylmuramoyl-L-alanine amidase [Candidatus Acidoferrales bacterium]|nr:N-acetylmuramoyl-L-alanine amidase [Candidatus Acidoferrales bacterium]